jgi:hypothetical protein
MPLSIAKGKTFWCYAYPGFSCEADLPDENILADGLWALRQAPVALANHWCKWLGSFVSEDLKRAGLFICAIRDQPGPGIVADEELRRRLKLVAVSLLLMGSPRCDRGLSLAGANESGVPEVRTYAPLRSQFAPPRCGSALRLTADHLRRVSHLVCQLRKIDTQGDEWRRLRRGLNILHDATIESFQDERIHQLVRALEAVIAPAVGKSQKQFIHRAQTFAVASQHAGSALEESYKIRSRVEHLHRALEALVGDQSAREATLFRRTRQMDALARFAFERIISSDQLLEHFKNDVTIQNFWAKSDHERAAIFGAQLDLNQIA